MHLKSLELAGFKSFAKKTALNFNTPISAIVGPNGSGKSNVAEAFRFVLGEQSIKSMRGKRTEDLIWNGSPALPRQNRASVKLAFDNPPALAGGKRLFSLDFDEIVLERIVYRDASTEYLLNGSRVRLRDIVEALSGARIGPSGHHIISQGEADRILNANLKERREMIEDALGLKLYQWKREESERKLEKTTENMKQVEGLRQEIAPHLAFLKRQVEKVERAKAIREELRLLYGEYLKREHAHIASVKESAERDSRAPREELAALERSLAAVKKTLEETRGKDARVQAILKAEESLRRFRAEREEVSRDIGRIEGEIAGAAKLLGDAGGGGETSVPLSEIEPIAEETRQNLLKSGSDASLLRSAFEKTADALARLVDRYRSRAKAHLQQERLSAEVELLEQKKGGLEKNLAEIRGAEQEMAQTEKNLRAEIEREKDSNREAEREMFRIMARQNELRGILHALAARRSEAEHAESDFKRELAEAALLAGREAAEHEKAEMRDESGKLLSAEELAREGREKQEARRRRIEKLKIRIEETGASGGAEAEKEYEETAERDRFLARELEDLERGARTLRELTAELEKKIAEDFEAGISKINAEFQKFFSLMFDGGEARLSVVQPKPKRRTSGGLSEENEEGLPSGGAGEETEEETGIEIEVNLPRKKIKGLMMLSGGERALTSIALIFAMSQVMPPPFIILDETDAALDEANSKKYGDMIENLSKFSQLILITHNRETMSRAGIIYGVTMDRSGVSKLLSIAFDEAAAVAK